MGEKGQRFLGRSPLFGEEPQEGKEVEIKLPQFQFTQSEDLWPEGWKGRTEILRWRV